LKNFVSSNRKKFMFIILAASVILILFALFQAFYAEGSKNTAEDADYEKLVFEYEGFRCRTLDKNSVEIIYSEPPSLNETRKLVVPASVKHNGKTYKVTSIGELAFYSDYGERTSVNENFSGLPAQLTIPNGITYIGGWALQGRSIIPKTTIPKSVTYVGFRAFGYSDVYEMSNSIKVKANGCAIVNNILIGFSGDRYERAAVTQITIPNGINQICESAFWGCTNLSVIDIPDSVTYFGVDAFRGTPWLENYPDDFVIINNVLIKYKGDDPNVTIPYGVTSIGDGAFCQNVSVESVIIPDGVTNIGELAFYGCTSLSCAYIPNSVTRIGHMAFSSITSYYSSESADIKIPDSVTYIGAEAFFDANLNSIVIPKGVSYIAVGTFGNFHSNMSYRNRKDTLIIPDGVVCIDKDAFEYSKIKHLIISKSVKYIHRDAFSGSEIEDITIYKDSDIDLGFLKLIKCENIIYK